ncbi:MAG: hypothetical protein Q9188_000268 [Gyalolechia gomerana]
MAASVLDSTSCTKKSRVLHVNDENADPETFRNAAHGAGDENCLALDNLEDPFLTSLEKLHANAAYQAKAPAKAIREHNPSLKADILADTAFVSTNEREILQVPTPHTPRHRDALSKKIPITPRRVLTPVGRSLTPRTPRTPITPANIPTIYHDARQSFVRSADPGRLVGRDAERKELETFIRDSIDRRVGHCLYVSGPPGTGKSALVREVCQEFASEIELRRAFVNCMSVKTPGDIHRILWKELVGEGSGSTFEQDGDLYSLMAPKKKKTPGPVYLVVLDEIDHLLDLDLEVLYALFELALRRNSRLVLIGIANALDLTDRFLPRLKARNLRPQLLPFLPYTAPQVASVITAKLRALLTSDESIRSDYVPFVHPTAIEFCSKKVASQTGDLRKAFDIVYRSLALVESETKQTLQKKISAPISPSKSPLSENPNLSSPKIRPSAAFLDAMTPMTAPRVTIAHIARITASALGNGTSQRLQTLNLQQRAALCALVSLEKKKRLPRCRIVPETPSKCSVNSSPTVRDLYRIYSSLCKRDNALHPLAAVEFCDVIGGLETLGLVGEGDARGIIKGTPGRKAGKGEDRRVSCWVSEKELETCLDGAGGAILRGLLADDE